MRRWWPPAMESLEDINHTELRTEELPQQRPAHNTQHLGNDMFVPATSKTPRYFPSVYNTLL